MPEERIIKLLTNFSAIVVWKCRELPSFQLLLLGQFAQQALRPDIVYACFTKCSSFQHSSFHSFNLAPAIDLPCSFIFYTLWKYSILVPGAAAGQLGF